jgi:preprotein translocase subunit YajC
MNPILAIGSVIFLFVATGLVFYLFRLNRQAKKEQSEIDPEKLRPWSDD